MRSKFRTSVVDPAKFLSVFYRLLRNPISKVSENDVQPTGGRRVRDRRMGGSGDDNDADGDCCGSDADEVADEAAVAGGGDADEDGGDADAPAPAAEAGGAATAAATEAAASGLGPAAVPPPPTVTSQPPPTSHRGQYEELRKRLPQMDPLPPHLQLP